MAINSKAFGSKEQKQANYLLDLYLGCQKTHLKKMLDGEWEDKSGTRDEWRARGIIPRVRNITKSIVDKSGLLFNDRPTLTIKTPSGDTIDGTLNQLLETSSWLETMQTVDAYTRLLKSTVVLAQRYIPTEVETVNGEYRFNAMNGEGLKLTILHVGNCVVEKDPLDRIIELAYLIDVPAEHIDPQNKSKWAYRRITPDLIEDYIVTPSLNSTDTETLIHTEINPEGIVPAVMFLDTAKPYQRSYPHLPEDIISAQEFLNLSLTDTEFAVAWSKNLTLFTNKKIESSDGIKVGVTDSHAGEYDDAAYASGTNITGEKSIGGLGSIVTLEENGDGVSPFVEFKGPNSTQLEPLNKIVDDVVKAVAADWGVNLRNASSSQAASGFALIVESMDNLSLRETRSHYFSSGLKQLHAILQVLYPELLSGELVVDFAKPSLPINKTEQQQLWKQRLDAGLASRVDYFIEVKNMTKEEALAKIAEIDALVTPAFPVETVIVDSVEE